MTSFKRTTVGLSETRLFDSLVLDYLDGKASRFSGNSAEPYSFDSVLKSRAEENFTFRSKLVEVLKSQHKDPSALQQNNIEALSSDKTFTVVTGHQLNLFTGPLYFIFKIVTTINLAEKLTAKYPDYHFVPVYWMASEDHDIAEINHINLFNKKIEWKTEQKGAAGRLDCKGVAAAIEEVNEALGGSDNAKKAIELLKKSYADGNSLADGTRILVNELFGKYGLLILNPDNAELKKEFIEVMKDDLINHSAFSNINQTIEDLKKNNHNVQVHPREINLFYLEENSRARIIAEGNLYKVLDRNKQWSEKELLKELEENPERFSPNVVLRPLYQESVLPNIAYVGGPAELAYWLEYKSAFDHYKINYPVLVLRNTAMLVDAASKTKMERTGFKPEDFFQSIDELGKQYVLKNDHPFLIKEEEEQIKKIFESIEEKIAAIDPTLKASVEAEKQKQLNALKALEEKAIRAGKKKHEVAIQQIQKIKEKLFPGNTPHERVDNFLVYYEKYGDAFFDALKKNFNPLEKAVTILVEERGS